MRTRPAGPAQGCQELDREGRVSAPGRAPVTADCHPLQLGEQVGNGSGLLGRQGSPGRLLAVAAGGLDGVGSLAGMVDMGAPDADPEHLSLEAGRRADAGSVPG